MKKVVLTYIINFITLHRVLHISVITSKTQAGYNSCMNLHASHSLVKNIFYYPYTIFCMCLVDRVSIVFKVVTDVSGLRSLSFFFVRYIDSCDVRPINFSLCLQITSFRACFLSCRSFVRVNYTA